MERLPTLIKVAVSGGLGSTSINLGGNGIAVGVKPPSGNPTYDFEITDVDGFGLCGISGVRGISTVPVWTHFFGSMTLTISNADLDGDWLVKVWYEE